MKTYSNLGLPIILSDAPEYNEGDTSLPAIFLILASRSAIERKITSYTIYVAGSNRALVNQIYSTAGVSFNKAFKDAYGRLETMYNDAVSQLSDSISNYDTVIWRCDNVSKAN